MLRKDVTFARPGPAITQDHLDAAKTALGGIALPLDYERYLLRFNGARPELTSGDPDAFQFVRVWWPADTVADRTDHVALVNDFCDVDGNPDKASDLVRTHADIEHLLPPDTLAFADEGGGSRFLFDLRPDRFGQVLFWRYEALGDETLAAAHPFHNVAWVAPDFVEFINRIQRAPADWAAWEAALPPDADVDWHPE